MFLECFLFSAWQLFTFEPKMKRRLLILALVGLTLASFNALHKYYVSTTNVEYSEADRSLQVITRIFTDDLEKLLNERYGIEARLATEEESKLTDRFLQKYFSQKLTFRVNGEAKTLNFLGKTYEQDIVKCFIEVEGVHDISSISVENQLLFDIFGEQQNIVHLKVSGTRKSFLLVRENDKGLLKL